MAIIAKFTDIAHFSIAFEFNLDEIHNNLPDLIKEEKEYKSLNSIKERIFRDIYHQIKAHSAIACKQPYGYAILVTLQRTEEEGDLSD